MINVFTNTRTLTFESCELFDGRKFLPLVNNSLYKLPTSVLRLDGKIYTTNNITIVALVHDVDLLLDEELEATEVAQESQKVVIRKIKKIISSYEAKFQLGLTNTDLEMLSLTKSALAKYKMLKKLGLQIVPGGEND